MTLKNKFGEVPDRSFMRLIYELYGQPAVDEYLKQFTEEDDDDAETTK